MTLPNLIDVLTTSVCGVYRNSFINELVNRNTFTTMGVTVPIIVVGFTLTSLVNMNSSMRVSMTLKEGSSRETGGFFAYSMLLVFLANFVVNTLVFLLTPTFAGFVNTRNRLTRVTVGCIQMCTLFDPVAAVIFTASGCLEVDNFIGNDEFLGLFVAFLAIDFLILFLNVLSVSMDKSTLSSYLTVLAYTVVTLVPFIFGETILEFMHPGVAFGVVHRVFIYNLPVFLGGVTNEISTVLVGSTLLHRKNRANITTCTILVCSSNIIRPVLCNVDSSIRPTVKCG